MSRTIIDIEPQGDEVMITLDNGVVFWTDSETAEALNLYDEIPEIAEEE